MNYTPEHGNLQKFAGGFDFRAFFHIGEIAEQHATDLGLLEVEREADDAVAEVEHLVEHRVGEAFDLGHTVANFADSADVLFGDTVPSGKLFDLVNHLNLGSPRMLASGDAQGLLELARLNLLAGQRAKSTDLSAGTENFAIM